MPDQKVYSPRTKVGSPKTRRAFTDAFCSQQTGNTLTQSPQFWAGTFAAYDALATKDANTIYLTTAGIFVGEDEVAET